MYSLRLLSVAAGFFCLAACSGGGGLSSAIPSSVQNPIGATSVARSALDSTIASTDAFPSAVGGDASDAASPAPWRVHAFLEDSDGNFGCLFSGNYAAVTGAADATSFGGSSKGKHACPASFSTLRRNAGFKMYAYNDIVFVGNSMPISAISSEYYFENSACNKPFVQPSGGTTNPQLAGREVTNLADYAPQIATEVNKYEASIDADYFFNDNFGNIGSQGIDTANLCSKQYNVSAYTAAFPGFIDALTKPQIVNLAGDYGDVYTDAVAKSHPLMVSAEEGLINFSKNAMFSLTKTESGLNRLLQLQAAGIPVVFMQYNPADVDSSGNPVEFPAGFNTMIDQRMWNYAGGWMVLGHHYFWMWTSNEGNFTNSGATVEPEYYFVPTNPVKAVIPVGSASSLQVGNVLVREFKACYYKMKLLGTCATVLNPNSTPSTVPKLTQTYAHSVVLTGEGAMPALAGVDGGVSTPADTGTFSATGPKVTSIPAGRAAILIQ